MRPHSWVVNIARGSLIDTDALVDALEREAIGGAALDVTDPEPLPDGHPLWRSPRALITPHVANPPSVDGPPPGRSACTRTCAASRPARSCWRPIERARGY